jgi:4-amino-4-deoxy-L-arabinose transferase-like glycosyltransferase
MTAARAGAEGDAAPRGPGRRHALWLALATLALLVPFLDKPFNIDEPLFLWLGRQVLERPWDFYGFAVNWYGVVEPMHAVTKNPPLAGYLVAAAAGPFGFGERALHAVFLLPALAAVLGTYAVARRLCRHPFEAALLAATTPVFLVCASSVMCDVLALALFVWALAAWLAGIERERFSLLALAGVLATASALAKYFGASVLPLCFAWGLLARRRVGAWCLPLLASAVAIALFEAGTLAAYGTGLFSDAARYAAEGGELGKPSLLMRGVVGLSFLGGCVVACVGYAPFLWRLRILAPAAALAAAGVWLLQGTFRPMSEMEATVPPVAIALGTRLQIVVTALGGGSLLALAALDLRRRRDRGSVLLALWLGGTFVFASFLNWTNNGRSILPLAPAAAILLVRQLECRFPAPGPALAAALRVALAPALAVALAVVWADARWAHAVRDEAVRLLARHHDPADPLLFQGHWGFQYYLQAGGARALDLGRDVLQPGQRIAVATNNVARIDGSGPLALLEVTEAPEPRWLRTHSWQLGAGFYSSLYGPLPYAFGAAPPDRYTVFRVERRFRYVIEPNGATRPEELPSAR